jgi:hypothetical protein
MLSLGDPKWRELKGGYKVPYDASVALSRLERGEDVWDELWQELHHQGDVGDASYAAVPHVVRIAATFAKRDWNLYGLVSTIEIERHRKSNPPLPEWIADSYEAAWRQLLMIALGDLRDVQDGETLRSLLGTVALAKSDLKLGALLSHADESEISDILEQRDAWSTLYRS